MAPPRGALLVSCYELGRQPLAVATSLAVLAERGHRVAAIDLAVEAIDRLERCVGALDPRLVAISVPMHTALHIGVRAARRLREIAPRAHLCFFGSYAWLNADYLLEGLADSVVAGESEELLAELADALAADRSPSSVGAITVPGRAAAPALTRLRLPVPVREPLPTLEQYARLQVGSEERLAAAVETTRGCLHLCRHCPIPPVYSGRFFVVPREAVLEDIRRVVAAGARHVTFADPDFLNGPTHAMRIARAMHEEHPDLTFDMTAKVEHVLEHRALLGELAECGCLFVVSAVESMSDEVLVLLNKGHDRQDAFEVLRLLREVNIVLRPTFVAFTPWTRIDDYIDVLDWVERDGLVDHVDAVQLSIRLLVPPGSGLLELDELQPHLRGLSPERFSWDWEHPDPRMDRLCNDVTQVVRDAAASGTGHERVFERIRDLAYRVAGRTPAPTRYAPRSAAAAAPRMTEAWFC